jgi:hypothetical protein
MPETPSPPASSHLAQLNIGRLAAPLDSPRLHDFVAALDEINALADKAPGFVWRFVGENANNATAVQLFADPLMIVNFSVWRTSEDLWNFVYRSDHLEYLRRRREWFELMREAYQVLWWIPAGTIPTPAEGLARLEELRANGPSPRAFTFRDPHPPVALPVDS